MHSPSACWYNHRSPAFKGHQFRAARIAKGGIGGARSASTLAPTPPTAAVTATTLTPGAGTLQRLPAPPAPAPMYGALTQPLAAPPPNVHGVAEEFLLTYGEPTACVVVEFTPTPSSSTSLAPSGIIAWSRLPVPGTRAIAALLDTGANIHMVDATVPLVDEHPLAAPIAIATATRPDATTPPSTVASTGTLRMRVECAEQPGHFVSIDIPGVARSCTAARPIILSILKLAEAQLAHAFNLESKTIRIATPRTTAAAATLPSSADYRTDTPANIVIKDSLPFLIATPVAGDLPCATPTAPTANRDGPATVTATTPAVPAPAVAGINHTAAEPASLLHARAGHLTSVPHGRSY